MTIRATHTAYAGAYGRTIAIERDDTSFGFPFLPFAWNGRRPEGEIDRRYTVLRSEAHGWSVAIDGSTAVPLADSDAVTEYIESDLHHWLATYTRGFLFVHAGCVGWRERAIVIPGRSYAGKTTLTQALLEAGAIYYSDDYAVIDHQGAIHAFPRRLRVRSAAAGPSQLVDPQRWNRPIGERPLRAGVVAALAYDAQRGWAVEQLSRGLGALSLLDNTVAARERPEDALRMMSIAMTGAIAIKGTRDDAVSSARRLIAMVDGLVDGRE